MLLVLLLDALPVVGKYLPAQLLEWAGGIMSGNSAAAWAALAATCGLILLFLGVACLRFEREEI